MISMVVILYLVIIMFALRLKHNARLNSAAIQTDDLPKVESNCFTCILESNITYKTPEIRYNLTHYNGIIYIVDDSDNRKIYI